MVEYYNNLVAKLEQILSQDNLFTKTLSYLENLTGLKKNHTAQVLIGLVAIYLIFGYFAKLLCNSVGFLYPAYASIKALDTEEDNDDTKWLMYWVVFAFFNIIEYWIGFIFSWFPFYYIAKITLLLWCMAPLEYNGSNYIYDNFIRTIFYRGRKSSPKPASD